MAVRAHRAAINKQELKYGELDQDKNHRLWNPFTVAVRAHRAAINKQELKYGELDQDKNHRLWNPFTVAVRVHRAAINKQELKYGELDQDKNHRLWNPFTVAVRVHRAAVDKHQRRALHATHLTDIPGCLRRLGYCVSNMASRLGTHRATIRVVGHNLEFKMMKKYTHTHHRHFL